MKKLQYLFLGFLLLCATALTAEDIELANGSILRNAKILSATHESMNVFHDGQIRTIAAEDLSIKARELHLSGKVESVEPLSTNLGQRPVLHGERLFLNRSDGNPVLRALSSLPSKVIADAGSWKKISIEVWVNDDPELSPSLPSVPTRPTPSKTSKSGVELENWKWVYKSGYISIDGVLKNISGESVGKIKMIVEAYGDGKYIGNNFCYSDRDGVANGGTTPFSLSIWDVPIEPDSLKISYTFEY